MADKYRFWPIRGTYDQIMHEPYVNGRIYFAYDTNQIILDVKGSKHIMSGGGASGSGIVYAGGTEEIKKVTCTEHDARTCNFFYTCFDLRIPLSDCEAVSQTPYRDEVPRI